jgi:hypothetical protein
MPGMASGRYYATVMPVAGIVYVIVLFATGFNGTVTVIGALVFALIAVVGSTMLRGGGTGRRRNRDRTRG